MKKKILIASVLVGATIFTAWPNHQSTSKNDVQTITKQPVIIIQPATPIKSTPSTPSTTLDSKLPSSKVTPIVSKPINSTKPADDTPPPPDNSPPTIVGTYTSGGKTCTVYSDNSVVCS